MQRSLYTQVSFIIFAYYTLPSHGITRKFFAYEFQVPDRLFQE